MSLLTTQLPNSNTIHPAPAPAAVSCAHMGEHRCYAAPTPLLAERRCFFFMHSSIIMCISFWTYISYISCSTMVLTGCKLVGTSLIMNCWATMVGLVYSSQVHGCLDIENECDQFGLWLPLLGSKKPDWTRLSNPNPALVMSPDFRDRERWREWVSRQDREQQWVYCVVMCRTSTDRYGQQRQVQKYK
jgi:hypothetical protein